MCKDSLVRRSKLKLSYPSAQFSYGRNVLYHSLWLMLFRDILPIVHADENILMNQQIDKIVRRNFKIH